MASINKKTPNLAKLSRQHDIPYDTLYRRWKENRPLLGPTEITYLAFRKRKTMAEWAKLCGLSTKNLYDRYVYHRDKYELTNKKALEKVLKNCGVKK